MTFPKTKPPLEERRRWFFPDESGLFFEVEGKIENTNAKFREGNKVTLVELDFNGIVNDADKLTAALNADSYEDAAKAFNSVKGMKIEAQKSVKVAFK